MATYKQIAAEQKKVNKELRAEVKELQEEVKRSNKVYNGILDRVAFLSGQVRVLKNDKERLMESLTNFSRMFDGCSFFVDRRTNHDNAPGQVETIQKSGEVR